MATVKKSKGWFVEERELTYFVFPQMEKLGPNMESISAQRDAIELEQPNNEMSWDKKGSSSYD